MEKNAVLHFAQQRKDILQEFSEREMSILSVSIYFSLKIWNDVIFCQCTKQLLQILQKKGEKTYYKLQIKTVYLYSEQKYFQKLAFFMKRTK